VPSIADIHITVAALERANFAVVAREQHVSQSTVSRAVQRVEAALGIALFERDGRNTAVHREATLAVERLRALLDVWNELVAGERIAVTTLSIFCTVTASQSIAPQLLAAFRRAHPLVALDLRTGPASAALDAAKSGEVDAAIAPLPERLPKSMVSVEITTTPLVAVTARDRSVPRNWNGVHLVAPRQGVTRTLVDQWRRSLGASHTMQDTESHEEVVALTALGSGIGIVPRLVLESSALRTQLRELKPPARLPTMRIGLCARASATRSGALALLWDMVSN
jgi:LysR family transcriptional regulator, positive regulator for ilvC